MGKSRKQKRALRVRQKMVERQARTIQIRGIIKQLDEYADRIDAGLPLYPQTVKENE